jgi:hypothetical protein
MGAGTKVLIKKLYRRISRTSKKYKKYNSNYTKMEGWRLQNTVDLTLSAKT